MIYGGVSSLVRMKVGSAAMLVPGPDDHLAETYAETGTWYENDLLSAIKVRQQGGVFVDVGAHYGNHTVFFALECHAAHVIAVEPHPINFEILTANIEMNEIGDRVEAIRALIHPSWRTASLDYPTEEQMAETWCASMLPVISRGGDTPCYTLDGLLDGVDVAAIKIDVENLGPSVLATGLATLARCHPLLAIEAELEREQEAVEALLVPLGYRCLGRYCATPTFLWLAA